MSALLITVAGPDGPGITSALTSVLSRHQIALLDIEQVVVRGQLTLCLLVDLEVNSEQGELALKDLLFSARKAGQTLEYREINVAESSNAVDKNGRYAVTVMGDPIGAKDMHQLAHTLAAHGANIDYIRRLSDDGKLHTLEIALTMPDGVATQLKEVLMSQMAASGIDIALQKEAVTRRNKRLVVMDMDSTLIDIEVIDELAKIHGVGDEVSAITHQAMNGEFDFSESLRRRVALLKGLEFAKVEKLASALPLHMGARELVKVLKGLGYKVGIISGGFHVAADVLKNELGLDFAFANRLDVADGKLTGKVIDPIVDAEKKAQLLEQVAKQEKIPLEQTIAIGDGANDALMLAHAGLGIAFHAKPALKKAATTSVSSGGLERILYLLGMSSRDINEFLSP